MNENDYKRIENEAQMNPNHYLSFTKNKNGKVEWKSSRLSTGAKNLNVPEVKKVKQVIKHNLSTSNQADTQQMIEKLENSDPYFAIESQTNLMNAIFQVLIDQNSITLA